MSHGDGLLAVGTELRPQLCDRRVVAEHAALDEHVDQGRGHSLADRIGVEHGVRPDRTPSRRVSNAGDGVDYRFAVLVDGDLQATLGAGLDQLVDGFLDLLLNVVHDRFPLLVNCLITGRYLLHGPTVTVRIGEEDEPHLVESLPFTSQARRIPRGPTATCAAIETPPNKTSENRSFPFDE